MKVELLRNEIIIGILTYYKYQWIFQLLFKLAYLKNIYLHV